MSYHRGRSGLGDVASLAAKVSDLSTDPYLNETICRLEQVKAIRGNDPVSTCARTPAGLPGGVGLRKAVPLLRGYVFAEQHPWVYPIAVGAIVGLPVLVGFLLGRATK